MPEDKNQLEELFLREKPVKIFLGIKTTKDDSIYTTVLSKQADCTFSHTFKILNSLEKMGLVTFEKTGRIKTVKLTDDGKEVATNLDSIVKKLNQLKEKNKEEKKEEKPKKDLKKQAKGEQVAS